MTDRFTTKGFADYFIEQRGHTNTFLDRIDTLIDWKRIEKVLRKNYRKTASAEGRPAYHPLLMFKLLLLQRWHGLSDPGLEEALNDRISFIRFAGFSVSSTLPDHSTICRFRNALLERNLFGKLFEEITRQLEEQSILIKESNGAIVDATIIESSRRPRKVVEFMPEDRKEDTEEISSTVISYSDDHDASWVMKGKKPYYGYMFRPGTKSMVRFFQQPTNCTCNFLNAGKVSMRKSIIVSCLYICDCMSSYRFNSDTE